MIGIDRLVATEVMGENPIVYQIVTDDGGRSSRFDNHPRSDLCNTDVHAWLRDYHKRGLLTSCVVMDRELWPQYSTDIAHAHMFRDKVLAERAWIVESLCWNIGGKRWFRVVVTDRTTDEDVCAALVSECEPLAICLALLRACGVPEEKIKEALDGKA